MPKLMFAQSANENIHNVHCQEISSVYKHIMKENQCPNPNTRDKILPMVSGNEYSSKGDIETKTTINCNTFLSTIGPQSFPQQLMSLLDRNEYEDVISWMPDGNTFNIHKKENINEVLAASHCFEGTKFESFRRKLNRWGFKIMKTGVDTGSYYHEHFLRDRPLLCGRIRCVKRGSNICKNQMDDQLEATKDSNKLLYGDQVQQIYVSKNRNLYEDGNFAKGPIKIYQKQGSKSDDSHKHGVSLVKRRDSYLQNTPDLDLKLQEYFSKNCNYNRYSSVYQPNRVSESLLLKHTYLSSEIPTNAENSKGKDNFQESVLSVLADVSTEKLLDGGSNMSLKKRIRFRKDEEKLSNITHYDIEAKLGPVIVPFSLKKDDAKPKTHNALAALAA